MKETFPVCSINVAVLARESGDVSVTVSHLMYQVQPNC